MLAVKFFFMFFDFVQKILEHTNFWQIQCDHISQESCEKTGVEKFPFRTHCYCVGQEGGRMVACDHCDRWYHVACLSKAVGSGRASWLCQRCVM